MSLLAAATRGQLPHDPSSEGTTVAFFIFSVACYGLPRFQSLQLLEQHLIAATQLGSGAQMRCADGGIAAVIAL